MAKPRDTFYSLSFPTKGTFLQHSFFLASTFRGCIQLKSHTCYPENLANAAKNKEIDDGS